MANQDGRVRPDVISSFSARVTGGLRLIGLAAWRGVVEFYNSDGLTHAASIAYYALLSLFPFILLLLSILGMLDTPDGGEYWFDGQNVAGYREDQLNELRRGRIGFIFQGFNLIEELSVEENVEFALEYSSATPAERRERVASMLEKLGVAHRAKHRPSQLSGGQQQRVAVARALVTKPAVLLADEPTGNLDSAHGEEVMELLRKINDEGTTIVMVTHSPAHAARAKRTVGMLDGAIV